MKRQNDEFTQVLDICLDQVLSDGGSVESCLQRYPEHAAELKPLLRLAVETRQALDFTPSAAAKATARIPLQEAVRQQATRQRWQTPWRLLEGFFRQLSGRYRWAMGATAALLFVMLGGTGIVTASSNSLPDQPLYTVKRAVEQAQLAITFDDHAKARRHAAFAARRSEEMVIMAEKGDRERVQRLAGDVNRDLLFVQRTALSGVSLTAFELRAVPGPDGQPQEFTLHMVPLRPSPIDRPRLEALYQRLEEGLRRHDRALQQALQNAPEPAREEMRKAHVAAQQKYRALIQAMQWLAEEDEPAKKDVTPVRRR